MTLDTTVRTSGKALETVGAVSSSGEGGGIAPGGDGAPYEAAPSHVAFTAYGVPAAQGSLRSLGAGRPTVHSNAKTLLPWREVIAHEAASAMGLKIPMDGPVRVTVGFTLPRPKSAKPGALPISRRLDIDKGCRAVLDALSNVVYHDDSQVVFLQAVKVYEDDPLALVRPGVRVEIAKVTE